VFCAVARDGVKRDCAFFVTIGLDFERRIGYQFALTAVESRRGL